MLLVDQRAVVQGYGPAVQLRELSDRAGGGEGAGRGARLPGIQRRHGVPGQDQLTGAPRFHATGLASPDWLTGSL